MKLAGKQATFTPLKVIDVELSEGIRSLEGLVAYGGALALVRWRGTPLSYVSVPLINGACSHDRLHKMIVEAISGPLTEYAVLDRLAAGLGTRDIRPAAGQPDGTSLKLPSMTVAVCTRDRTDDLRRCLKAIELLDHPDLNVLVIDNAPTTDATKRLLAEQFPHVAYFTEPRPGIDWARNRAIVEARGDVIAFTDDDVVVDRGWAEAIGLAFAEEDNVMAVTGLVVPLELETWPQALFEDAGGFGRGFRRHWFRLTPPPAGARTQLTDVFHLGPGRFGTGANMAFRKRVFDLVGVFDPALGAGTVTQGGDDLEMFFRVLEEGHTLVYEPRAIVRHLHRPQYEGLRSQLGSHGLAYYAFATRSAFAYPNRRAAFARFGLVWFWRRNLRRLLLSYIRPGRFPRDLIYSELRGAITGLFIYPKARREAQRIERGGEVLCRWRR
jgi:O-antigen biosynthesis protein